ncbi:sugar ABC transporter substrate-binding protein [Anaerolineae bacterium CFX9]|jgi:multiple sugar transport system substrate-binding protein|nr:sugar ABC transporter substrate-binding protein [Oscillatoria laete-virens]MDI9636015.1 sugar ABC transporter substrate-binding protein [Geitlerinema splendidum]MDK3157369.1 sugar ABC transporter substrate-binding protein [Kamptonema cortianum]MDL1902433.1 sugar ABC transporter substrate-binding protein [Anaerolineae bacterium CFX9]MDL5054876.1 sugar ABC transporter substrate-binding protein [Oscillatoria laete-virens NRMC-F 0139]
MKRLSKIMVISSTLILMLLTVGGIYAQDPVVITYWLWDVAQVPQYEQCAADFEAANPNIDIRIEQPGGWFDYWTALQTALVGGNAPDVFTNHLSKYPEFANLGQIVDIQPFVERDGVDVSNYLGELAALWTRGDARYGLPKDWDTVALVYNVDMIEAAGIDPAVFETWTWNPEDGGTFQEIVAQLTLDANGNNGLSPDFDRNNVVQFGLVTGQGGGFNGHEQWSHFAASTGWTFTDGPWAESYHYDDPRFIDTIQWYADLHLVHGLAPSFAEVGVPDGEQALFAAGEGAMVFAGSWRINFHLTQPSFDVGFALPPIGPEGRKTMFNGLADSIYSGTPHVEEAWQWVRYLASVECQVVVGEYGIVFPAIAEGVEASLAARAERGIDVSAFTSQALDPNGTFIYPITDRGSEVAAIMGPIMDSIRLGEVTAAEALPMANAEVNALFNP